MENKKSSLWSIIVAIFVFFVGCAAMYWVIYSFPNLFSTTKLEKNVTVTDKGIADAVDKVYNSVVIVSNYKNDQLYVSGSGFVFKTDKDKAYILTNNHVIDGSDSVSVTLTSGEVVETQIVGSDLLSDIAVLSMPVSKIISVADIGNSGDLRVGDTSFTVGAPIDSVYSWTVTRGIISGKDRMVEVELSSTKEEYVMKVIQTDAAINSGNSGGPLCNSNGEVVGITSLKLVNESVEGMGFAIPIETATEYAEKLIKGETISQPYLGVSMLNVSSAYQRYNTLREYNITNGVYVVSVEKNSPAYKAGINSGDVIVKINDNSITSIGYLRYYLYNHNPGEKVKVTIIRNGESKIVTVTLGTNNKTY